MDIPFQFCPEINFNRLKLDNSAIESDALYLSTPFILYGWDLLLKLILLWIAFAECFTNVPIVSVGVDTSNCIQCKRQLGCPVYWMYCCYWMLLAVMLLLLLLLKYLYCLMMQLSTVVCRFREPSAVYRFDFRQMHMHWIACCHTLVATTMRPIAIIERIDDYHSCWRRLESFSNVTKKLNQTKNSCSQTFWK